MIKRHNSNTVTNFTGRNGYMKMKGWELSCYEGGPGIMIAPVTSKGQVGRCDMVIANEDIDIFIQQLQELKREVQV